MAPDNQPQAPNPSALTIDVEEASRFLCALGQGQDRFTFQTIDDNAGRHEKSLARILHGTLAQHIGELTRLQRRGAGVFVTVNQTDFQGRAAANITRVRAVWHECDEGAENLHFHCLPSIEVESSPGKRHSYWLGRDLSRDDHGGMMRAMVQLGSDPAAADLSRVLRLPGTWHQKDPANPHRVKLLSTWGLDVFGVYGRDELIKAFPITPAAPKKQNLDTAPNELREFDAELIMAWLKFIDPDPYNIWLLVGMALHFASGGSAEGFELWCLWASRSGKYNDGKKDMHDTWNSFRRKPGDPRKVVTLGTIYKLARDEGYQGPTCTNDDAFEHIEALAPDAPKLPKPLLKFPEDINLAESVRRAEGALVRGVLSPGNTAVLYGESGAGKTFLALDLAWSIARGEPWGGKKCNRAAVLYVSLEGQHGFEMRTLAIRNHRGDPAGHFAELIPPISLVRDKAGAEGVAKIVEAATQLSARVGCAVGLIVVDTLARATAGDDENDTAAMALFVQQRMGEISRQTGAAVVVVHHPNKQGTMRGSGVLLGAADCVLLADKTIGQDGIVRRSLTAEKVKDGKEGKLFSYRLQDVQLATLADGEPVTSCVVDIESPAAAPGGCYTALRDWLASEYAAGRFYSPSPNARNPPERKFAEHSGFPEPEVAKALEALLGNGLVSTEEYRRSLRDKKQDLPKRYHVNGYARPRQNDAVFAHIDPEEPAGT